MKEQSQTRFLIAKNRILKDLKSGKFLGERMPPEDIIADECGISVLTAREALRQLHREGFITKKQGSGNYIHRSALNMSMRVDLTNDITELLQGEYNDVVYTQMQYRELQAGNNSILQNQLKLALDDRIYTYDRLFIVEKNKVAIKVTNYIPEKYFSRSVGELIKHDSILDFVLENCGIKLVQSSVLFKPHALVIEESKLFDCQIMDPAIRWEEVFYDIHDRPVGISDVLFNPVLVNMKSVIKFD